MASTQKSEKVIRRIEWMRQVDFEIFDILSYGDGMTLNGAAMSRNIDYNMKYLNQRCHELADMGLLEEGDRGYFYMTDEALEAWNAGDVERFGELAEE